MISTVLITVALIIAPVAGACLAAIVAFQRAKIKALTEDNELCADEIERLNQHIIELMPIDESLYFEMSRSFGSNLTVIKGGKE